MDRLQFALPVRVQMDRSQPVTEIYSVPEAIAFLENWPAGRKGPVFEMALRCCRAVEDHQVTTEEARKSLHGFARITGLLARDIHHLPTAKDGSQPTQW